MKYIFNQLKNIIFIDIETVSGFSDYELVNNRLKKEWFRKASYLANTDKLSMEELYLQKAAIYAEFGKIACIGIGYFLLDSDDQISFRVKSIADYDEKKIIQECKIILSKFSSSEMILCTHNGKEFDFPYLCRRFLVNQIPLPSILDLTGKKPWEVKHMDTMEMWKFGDWKQYTSLELLATLFNIQSSKTSMDGSEVTNVYYQEKDLKKIAHYCCQDVIVTARVYLKLKCISWELRDELIQHC